MTTSRAQPFAARQEELQIRPYHFPPSAWIGPLRGEVGLVVAAGRRPCNRGSSNTWVIEQQLPGSCLTWLRCQRFAFRSSPDLRRDRCCGSMSSRRVLPTMAPSARIAHDPRAASGLRTARCERQALCIPFIFRPAPAPAVDQSSHSAPSAAAAARVLLVIDANGSRPHAMARGSIGRYRVVASRPARRCALKARANRARRPLRSAVDRVHQWCVRTVLTRRIEIPDPALPGRKRMTSERGPSAGDEEHRHVRARGGTSISLPNIGGEQRSTMPSTNKKAYAVGFSSPAPWSDARPSVQHRLELREHVPRSCSTASHVPPAHEVRHNCLRAPLERPQRGSFFYTVQHATSVRRVNPRARDRLHEGEPRTRSTTTETVRRRHEDPRSLRCLLFEPTAGSLHARELSRSRHARRPAAAREPCGLKAGGVRVRSLPGTTTGQGCP